MRLARKFIVVQRLIRAVALPLAELFPCVKILLVYVELRPAAILVRTEVNPEANREKQHDQRDSAGENQQAKKNTAHYFSASSAFLLIMLMSSAKLLFFKIWPNCSL